MSFHGRPSTSSQARPSSTPSQRRREPPRHSQGSSASSRPAPNKNGSRPSETKVIVLSDTDDESPGEKAAKPPVIEIDDDSDDEQSTHKPRDQPPRNSFKSLPPRDRYSTTQAAATPLPPKPGGSKGPSPAARLPVWDGKNSNRSLPPTTQNRISAQHERPPAPPTRQPPGFWDTKRPQPEAPRTSQPLQPQKQPQFPIPYSKASRKLAYASPTPQVERPQSERSQPQEVQPRSVPAGSSTRSTSTATTSTFPTTFKHYASSVPPNEHTASPKQNLPSVLQTLNDSLIATRTSTCVSCANGKLRCDGARPTCNRCTTAKVRCVWNARDSSPGRSGPLGTSDVRSHVQLATEVSKEARPKDDSAPVDGPQHQPTGREQASIPAIDSAPVRKTRIVLRAPHPPSSVRAEPGGVLDLHTGTIETREGHEQDPADTESSTSADDRQFDNASILSENAGELGALVEMESTLEAFTKLMEGLRNELHSWQEISTQAELRQATTDARRRPGPKLDRTLPDPFKVITEERRSAKDGEQERQQNKRLLVIRTTPTSFPTEAVMLPKYQSIGRVSSSVLAPNYKTAKHWAYSAEDEHDPDLNRKYKDFQSHYAIDFDGLTAQRQCQELVWLWKPWVEEAFSQLGIRHTDILYFFTISRFEPERRVEHGSEQWGQCRKCGLADIVSRRSHFNEESFKALPRPDDRSLAYAAFLARAFHDMTGVSLWHIAEGGLLQPQYEGESQTTAQQSSLCLICFRHRCPDHGSYKDPEEEFDAREGNVFVNDSEEDFNIRRYVSLPDVNHQADDKTHLCGAFCGPPLNLRRILGRQSGGSIDGDIVTSEGTC